MKKLLVMLVFISAFTSLLFSQGGNPGHLRVLGQFLGWDGTGPAGTLQVRNDFASQPITFFTGGSTPLFQRMIINGSTGPTAGFVGIGPNFTTPNYPLHLHTPGLGVNTFSQWTNGVSGNTAMDGLVIGIVDNAGFPDAQIHHFEDRPIDFFTNATPTHSRKMRIWHSALNQPRINIGNAPIARSYLQLGSALSVGGSGFRPWMNVGTLYVSENQVAPDNMYVGLRQMGPDRADAIIGWSDNPTTQPLIADRLRFVFTSVVGMGLSSTLDGLEFCRMVTDGNNPRIGFGDLFTPNLDPQSTLEIRASPSAPYWAANGGASGLRFTFLTSALTTPIVNPGLGVLSVDASGDVIYVTDNPGFAGPCPTVASTTLFTDFGTNLNNNNFYWEGNTSGTTSNNMGLGLNCGAPFNGKLHVYQNSASITGSIGIYVENNDQSGAQPLGSTVGIKSFMSTTLDFNKIAGWFEAPGPIGAQGTSIFVPQNGGQVTINFPGLVNTAAQLEVSGDIFASNNLITTTNTYPSDQQLKTNITAYNGGLNIIRQVSPVTFEFNGLGLTESGKKSVGVIAQQVQQINGILPFVIDTFQVRLNQSDTVLSDVMGVRSEVFLWSVVNAIKELDSAVTSLQNQMISNRSALSDNQVIDLECDIILYQNTPNPFNGETSIRYFIPDNASGARMLFFDETGRVIKEEAIQSLGDGTLTLKTDGLASGIYTYSLEVNGKIVLTRKMQKVK